MIYFFALTLIYLSLSEKWVFAQERDDNLQKVAVFRSLVDRLYNTDDVEEKIALGTAALALEPKIKSWPPDLSRQFSVGVVLLNTGAAYYIRENGIKSRNIEKAIEHFETALTMIARDEFAEPWAALQNNLGAAYTARHFGDLEENKERAIKAYEAALTFYTSAAFPQHWAEILNHLSHLYHDRVRGSRAENIEQVIKAQEGILSVSDRVANPHWWAGVQGNLADAYRNRINGSRAENLELAIKAFEAALTVFTRETYPDEWAQTQVGLGLVYAERIRGNEAQNIMQAIAHYKRALTYYTPQTSPGWWLSAQNNLGNAYLLQVYENKEENMERALEAYRASLSVVTREQAPLDWAKQQAQLALAYSSRVRGDRSDNIERAIEAAKAALTELTQANPIEWGGIHNNLASLYIKRISGDRAGNIRRATEHARMALDVFSREVWGHRYHLLIAHTLGKALLAAKDWSGAKSALASAREDFLLLFGQGVNEAEARALIQHAGSLFAEAAYAAVENGELEAALALLSEGKARLLNAALMQQSLDLPADKRARHSALQTEIRMWVEIAGVSKGTEGTAAVQHLAVLERELLELVESASAQRGPDGGVMALVALLVPNGGAVVAPIITSVGGKLLIAAAGKSGATITALDVPELTDRRLERLMYGDNKFGGTGGWIGAFKVQYLTGQKRAAHIQEWLTAIDKIGPELWRLFGGQLDSALHQNGINAGDRLVWLPAGALGLLPLGLLYDQATGLRFADKYELLVAPSLEVVAVGFRQLSQMPSISLAAVVNPTGDIPRLNLPFAEIEGALVASHFTGMDQIQLDRSNATPDGTLAALRGKRYWHFSGHGAFNWRDARQSGLILKEEVPLTVERLLEVQGGLGRPRLVVLSACETGLYETNRNPDEFVGLPNTFIQLGALGVLSSLWQVDDLATMLFISKFYDLHLGKGFEPAKALKQTQAWLREATKAELISYAKIAATAAKLDPRKIRGLEASIKSRTRSLKTRFGLLWNLLQEIERKIIAANSRMTDGRNMQSRPFAHPVYWGGFIYTGM
jgi:CHAT domain-containing protein